MSFAVTVKDAQDLRRLIPLNILSASRFEELCAQTGIEEVARGTVLFDQGDAKNEFVYVLSGTVSLQAGGMEMETITGGTESARFALAHQIPRKVAAIAKDRVRYIRVDSSYVNQPSETSTGTVATYEVSDIPGDAGDDWVTTLLKSPIFQRLPPANLQNILSLLEEVAVRAGQEIIHQDEPGDYYYVIKRGRCALTRRPSRLAREIKLAELKTTDTFGEDALISDQPRNVTVTMMTDGVLLRLNKANFLKLVKDPVISFVNMDTAQRMLQQEGRWLDVRAPDSFDEGHLPGAVNIPFFRLRMELANLSHQFKYILVCETGKVSEAAAFLLIRYGFEAFVLKGGISGVFKDQLVMGPVLRPQVSAHAPAGPAATRAQEPLASGKAPETEPAPRDPRDIPLALEGKPETAPGLDLGALKADVAEFKHSLARLQDDASALKTAESQLKQQLQAADNRAQEAVGSLHKLQEEIARIGAWGAEHGSASSAEQDLKKRLAEVQAEKEAAEHRCQEALREAEQRQNVQEAQSLAEAQGQRATAEKALAEAKTEIERLRVLLQRPQAAITAGEAVDSAEMARLVRENDEVSRRNQALERQVTELSSLVQEFVEQQGERGDTDGIEALRSELEMVRTQAEQDVMAMQRKLRDSGQESARLRSELDTAQQRLLLSEAGLASADGERRSAGRGLWIAALFAPFLAGAALVTGFALGTDSGRGLVLGLIEPPVPIPSTVPTATPVPPAGIQQSAPAQDSQNDPPFPAN